jgi:aldehyde:ferredoxin oxidoreductase
LLERSEVEMSGKFLDVDLSTGTIEPRTLDEETVRLFLGGRGLGARLLWDLVGPEVEPLSPGNALIFCTGPLTGTAFPTACRFSLSTKSPLTGTVSDSNSGGLWGLRLKRAGYDALVVRGRADSPRYLEITPYAAVLRDALGLWGRTVPETTSDLAQDPSRSVLCIGPAGENMVRFAGIMNDGSRALGRGGAGAVMGAKNLKAVVVEGEEKADQEDNARFNFVRYEVSKQLTANPVTSQALPQFGTAVFMNIVNSIGALPTRNFQQAQFDGAERISGEALADSLLVRAAACWECPIACTRVTKTACGEGQGPEYQSLWGLGAACGIADLEAIAEANYLCNELGLDTISTGSTIACAMELAQRGFIDGDLRFGRADLLGDTIRSIAYRRGLGDELAEGSFRFAQAHAAREYSMSVKGMELPAYDPRGMQGQGLLYATSNRGGCHTRGNMLGPEVLGLPKLIDRFQVQGKAGVVVLHQNSAAAVDSLVLCKFVSMAVAEEYYGRALAAATGAGADLVRVGERIWNLERLYNLREGFSREHDTLPDRLLEEPIPEGPSKGWVSHLPEMLDEYYRFRGWDEDGVPTKGRLEELGLAGLRP